MIKPPRIRKSSISLTPFWQYNSLFYKSLPTKLLPRQKHLPLHFILPAMVHPRQYFLLIR